MIDPEYCEEDGYSDGYEDGAEEYIFDTFDRVIDETELDADEPDPEGDSGMSSEHWGMAFALADEMADEAKGEYDLDINTDEENFRQAMRQNPPNGGRELRPFEQIIDDICKGRRSLFNYDY